MRVIRVFPRRTKATPTDELAYVGGPDLFAEADQVHISVAFTWDLPEAERLAREWRPVAPVSIGGPATGMRGGDFVPGVYLREGYTITSRGCPNRCRFCSVWRRDGDVHELPIRDGWDVLDDNLLACSSRHIDGVFSMLARQPHRPRFTGGLEPARLKEWHVFRMREIRTEVLYLAYDDAADWEPLRAASDLLFRAWTPASHKIRCYVLIGYPDDTYGAAEARIYAAAGLGLFPMPMLYRDESGRTDKEWRAFRRQWGTAYVTAVRLLAKEPA